MITIEVKLFNKTINLNSLTLDNLSDRPVSRQNTKDDLRSKSANQDIVGVNRDIREASKGETR